jgi:hypothetical protein
MDKTYLTPPINPESGKREALDLHTVKVPKLNMPPTGRNVLRKKKPAPKISLAGWT